MYHHLFETDATDIVDGRVKCVCLCSTNHTVWLVSMIGRAQPYILDSAINKAT
jgi:hypothetical protein